MTATDAQVRLLMKERNQGKTQEQAVVKANLRSRKTVAKYEKLGELPSELKDPRAYHSPNENGDVESSNGKLKTAINQHLLLRGSRDFESLAACESFLHGSMDKRNLGRETKLAEGNWLHSPMKTSLPPPSSAAAFS